MLWYIVIAESKSKYIDVMRRTARELWVMPQPLANKFPCMEVQ